MLRTPFPAVKKKMVIKERLKHLEQTKPEKPETKNHKP
jgi:hypothetical protein